MTKQTRPTISAMIAVVISKDLRTILRDPITLVFTLCIPLLVGIAFGSIFATDASDRTIKAAIVDESQSQGTHPLATTLKEAGSLDLYTYETRAEAQLALERGSVPTIIVILPSESKLATPSLSALNAPRVLLIADPAQRIARSIVEGHLYEAAANLITNSGPGGQNQPWRPVRIQHEISHALLSPPSSFHITFAQAMVWAIMGCAAAFASSLLSEQEAGTLLRLRLSPLPPKLVIAAKAMSCWITAAAAAALMLFIGIAFYGIKPSNILLTVIATVCACTCFAGIMLLLSVLGRTRSSASQMAWALMLAMALPGGGMLPLVIMPDWLSTVSVISPVRWAIIAIEGGLWRNLSVADATFACCLLIAIGLASYTAGAWLFAKRTTASAT